MQIKKGNIFNIYFFIISLYNDGITAQNQPISSGKMVLDQTLQLQINGPILRPVDLQVI